VLSGEAENGPGSYRLPMLHPKAGTEQDEGG